MGWFSKEKTLEECDKIAQGLNNVNDLPQECQKYEKIVDALKKKSGIAYQGAGRRATKNAQLVRRMTNTNNKR